MGRWEEGIFLGMNPCPQTLLMSGSVHGSQIPFFRSTRRDSTLSLFSNFQNAILPNAMYHGPLQRIRAYYHSFYFNTSYLRVVQKHIKELVRQTAMHVLNAGGVVRGIDSWGTCRLPQRMRRHQQYYDKGEWVEASPPLVGLC